MSSTVHALALGCWLYSQTEKKLLPGWISILVNAYELLVRKFISWMTDAEMQSSHLVLAGHRSLSESHFPIAVYTIRNPWSFATVLIAQRDFMQRFLVSLQKLNSTVNATVFCHTHCLFSWLCFSPSACLIEIYVWEYGRGSHVL